MVEKFKLFEEKIQMASQTAQDALDNMEKWRRRRVLLEQPIIKYRIIEKKSQNMKKLFMDVLNFHES